MSVTQNQTSLCLSSLINENIQLNKAVLQMELLPKRGAVKAAQSDGVSVQIRRDAVTERTCTR